MTIQLFNKLAPYYDPVNRLISLGQDRRWRRILCRQLPTTPGLSYVDLGTGTGDVILHVMTQRQWPHSVGVDPAQHMLDIATQKANQTHTPCAFLCAGAECLPFASDSIDVITMVFAIRNVANRPQSLAEMARVLKPNGTLAIMEFSWPQSPWIRYPFSLYFHHVMPLLAGWWSRQPDSYRYLARSVAAFPRPDAFQSELAQAGLRPLRHHTLGLGSVTLYLCSK